MKLRVDGRVDALTAEERIILLERRPSDEDRLRDSVHAIMARVRSEGDSALLEMAKSFDRVEIDAIEVPSGLWDEALAEMDLDVRAGLERAARNIRAFHEAQIPVEITLEVEPGVMLGRRAVPLGAVGVYAPGGRASYPSSVLMGVVPARAVGVGMVVVCSPPGSSGLPPAEVLAACAIGGADRLFAIGGAGAIAAMAFGTDTVPRVDAVVGPGNKWVTEAKRQVAGEIRIDSPAGPSEVLVVADSTASPRRIALELVAQAEHDPEAAVAFVGWEPALVDAVRKELGAVVSETPRRDIVEAALSQRGAILLAGDRVEALAFAEDYAAEHLALFTDEPKRDLDTQTTAGTVFLGDDAAVAFGDYITGANHVLPTSGRARSFSGLSSHEFLRFFTWQEISAEGASAMSEDVDRLARAERLPAHAASARERSTR